jgi:hypothetical protein
VNSGRGGVTVAVVVTVAVAVVAVRGRPSWGGRTAAASAGAAGSGVSCLTVDGAHADEGDGWVSRGIDRSVVFLVSPDLLFFSWTLLAFLISCTLIAMECAMSSFVYCPMTAVAIALLLLSLLKCCWLLR